MKDENSGLVDSRSSRRKARAKRNEKNRKIKKYTQRIAAWAIVIAIVALAIFGVVKLVQLVCGLFAPDYPFAYSIPADWAQYDDVSEVKGDYAIGIQHPLVNKHTDKVIKEDAKDMIKLFKDEIKQFETGKGENKAVYTASFSVVKNSDTYISVLYTVHRYNPLRGIDDIQYVAKIYDTVNGKAVTAEEIFDPSYNAIISSHMKDEFANNGAYAEKVSTRLFTDNTAPSFDNFGNIGFNGNSLVLYFGAGRIFSSDMGPVSVNVPLHKVAPYMKINITNYTPPRYDPDKPMIALTFDDGPRGASTTRILDALESVNGRATFFVLGERIPEEAEIIKRADRMGCEYGNHTWGHVNLATATETEITDQINKTDDALYNIIGKKTALARAPYAATNEMVFANVNKPFIGWTVDTMDWDTRDPNAIKAEVLRGARDGAIILMHDIYGETATAIEEVIYQLSAEGYQFVTVSEMMEARGVDLKPGKVYHSAPKSE